MLNMSANEDIDYKAQIIGKGASLDAFRGNFFRGSTILSINRSPKSETHNRQQVIGHTHGYY